MTGDRPKKKTQLNEKGVYVYITHHTRGLIAASLMDPPTIHFSLLHTKARSHVAPCGVSAFISCECQAKPNSSSRKLGHFSCWCMFRLPEIAEWSKIKDKI